MREDNASVLKQVIFIAASLWQWQHTESWHVNKQALVVLVVHSTSLAGWWQIRLWRLIQG